MFNIYKGNVLRLVKNTIFIIGCMLAFVITFLITVGKFPLEFLLSLEKADRMLFASAAMTLYFSFFTTLFVTVEYKDGVIRNRIISGFSQTQVYIASLLAQYSAVVIMHIFYLLGGLLGGAKQSGDFLMKILIYFLALIAYVTVTNAIAFRNKRVVASTILTMVLFNLCFQSVLVGNAIISFMEDAKAIKIAKMIYNIHALGQWFSLIPFSFDYTNPGYPVLIALSFAIIIPASVIGLIGLKKRELK